MIFRIYFSNFLLGHSFWSATVVRFHWIHVFTPCTLFYQGTLTMSPLESTIQIFFKHSSLAIPSFSMAMVISSAIPIAAWEQEKKGGIKEEPHHDISIQSFGFTCQPHAKSHPSRQTNIWSEITIFSFRCNNCDEEKLVMISKAEEIIPVIGPCLKWDRVTFERRKDRISLIQIKKGLL